MKLILTEIQYKILEAIIDEAALPMSAKIEKGGFIQVVYVVNDIEKSQTMEITDVYGTGKYVKGINKKGEFLINIGGSLDTEVSTFTVLLDAQYQEGGKDENGKIIAPQVVGGSKFTLKNVTQINISDSNKEIVDTISTNLGDEMKGSGEGEEESQEDIEKKEAEQEEYARREKAVYDEIMNNDLFRKAYYHQPKIFGGLLKYGKAKGIGPAKALMNKYIGGYNLDKVESGDKSKFKVGKNVKFRIGDTSVNLTHGTQTFILQSNQTYKARYNSQGELVGSMKMGDEKRVYKYQITIAKNIKDDIYKGEINVEFKGIHSGITDKSQEITFKVLKYDIN